MENEIILLKNKTDKKYNKFVDFTLKTGISKGWRFNICSVVITNNSILVTLVINDYSVIISSNDFDFSLCFHNRIYINHLEIQKYCKRGGNNG